MADDIRSSDRLAPLTHDQKIQRRIEIEAWQEEQAWLAEERRIERERQQDEAEAIARAEAAAEIAESNRLARLQRQEQIDRETQRRELADLRFKSAQHQAFQRNLENAARNTMAYQARQTLINEIEALTNPPAPPPESEPTVIYVAENELGSPNIADENFNSGYWLQKPIFRR